MRHIVLYGVLSGYAGLLAGWLLTGLMATAAKGESSN